MVLAIQVINPRIGDSRIVARLEAPGPLSRNPDPGSRDLWRLAQPVPQTRILNQKFYDAIEDALFKSLPVSKMQVNKNPLKKQFSMRNLSALEKFTGLDLKTHIPSSIPKQISSTSPVFSYIDLEVMLFRAIRDSQGDLGFYHNYLQYSEADKEAKQRIIELEAELSSEEIKAAKSLMRSCLTESKIGFKLEDLKAIALRSGILHNCFTVPVLELKDLNGKPTIRNFSKDEIYATLLEATVVSDRPAPYVYYHQNFRKKSKNGSFKTMSLHGHRLDYYQAEFRGACARGRYIWTQKIFDICKIIGVDTKTLSWDKFMAMVTKVNEISVRHLNHNEKISRRVAHVLTKDELHELCRSLGISQQHLLQQESVEQAQRRIEVGGCAPILV